MYQRDLTFFPGYVSCILGHSIVLFLSVSLTGWAKKIKEGQLQTSQFLLHVSSPLKECNSKSMRNLPAARRLTCRFAFQLLGLPLLSPLLRFNSAMLFPLILGTHMMLLWKLFLKMFTDPQVKRYNVESLCIWDSKVVLDIRSQQISNGNKNRTLL